MPKVVDHEERRRELGAAVWRVILRDGIEGVSIRDVAAEANWSSGAVRHYLTTRDELLAFAARMVAERVEERLRHQQRGGTAREAARAALSEVLPLDAERRAETTIWLAFASRGLAEQHSAEIHDMAFEGVRELCQHITHRLADGGHLAAGLEPDREARRLHALLDGVAMHAMMGRLDADAQLALLDDHLTEILRDG